MYPHKLILYLIFTYLKAKYYLVRLPIILGILQKMTQEAILVVCSFVYRLLECLKLKSIKYKLKILIIWKTINLITSWHLFKYFLGGFCYTSVYSCISLLILCLLIFSRLYNQRAPLQCMNKCQKFWKKNSCTFKP